MKIGIGIITYNRLNTLKRCLSSIMSTDYLKLNKIVVADDCSTDGTREWLASQQRIQPILGKNNVGVAKNSNRALKALTDVDYGFLINDDIYFKQKGWVDLYISAMLDTEYKHFCYMGGRVGPGFVKEEIINNHSISYHNLTMGSFLTFNQKVLETVGGFDSRFGKYGLEHADWTERISLAGLTRYFDVRGMRDGVKVVDLADSKQYIDDIQTDSVFSEELKNKYHHQALEISNNVRAEIASSGMKNVYRSFKTG